MNAPWDEVEQLRTMNTELLAQVDGLRGQLQRAEERALLDEDFDQLIGGTD